jgi:hypothetical protein
MGHFAIPASGKNTDADYYVDNKMAVGSVGRMVVPPSGSAEIVLCCADALAVRSNNPNVIKNPIPERLGDGGRILTITPAATTGGAYVDFGILNPDGWSWAPGSPWPGTLLVNVEARAAPPAPDGLVELGVPSLALNSHDTPVPYKLKFNHTVSSGMSARDVIGLATAKGRLKHLVFSCHGYISYVDHKITDSTISIGSGLNKDNVGLFSELKKSMSGGVIWAGACGIGNDNDTNKLRAANSGCFFVAPVMYMTMKPGSKRPGENMIDMYRRFSPKVFTPPDGALIGWDSFVASHGKRLGIVPKGS